MRKKTIALVGVLAVSLAMTTGCSLKPAVNPTPVDTEASLKQKADNVMPTTVYVADSNGMVVPLNIKMAKTQGIAKATLEQMIKGGPGDAALTGTGLRHVLPEGTQIRGVSINNGTAKVDFSKEVMNYKTAEEEQALVDAVVWTMTGLEGVQKVQMMVEGHVKPTMKMGTPVADAISRASGINLQVSPEVNPSSATKLTLYFEGTNEQGNFSYLVPVTRMIPAEQGKNMADLTVAELAKGPNAEGLGPVVQPTLKPLKSEVKDKVATLDFGDDFQAATSTSASESIIHSIVLSVAANAGVDQVRFTINGKTPGATEGFDLSKPVSVPLVINEQTL